MAPKVAKVGVKKEPGYLYFVDDIGDISRKNITTETVVKVAKVGIRKEPGYYYFVDKDGDIARIRVDITELKKRHWNTRETFKNLIAGLEKEKGEAMNRPETKVLCEFSISLCHVS